MVKRGRPLIEPLPKLDDYGIGLSCGVINAESYIKCEKERKVLRLILSMDSKSAVDEVAKVWGGATTPIYDKRRGKWRYLLQPSGNRAKMILDACERKGCLSDEKKEQYKKAKEECGIL